VDASGAALHVTWRVLEKRASEQNTVLIRTKKASPSSLRACAARPTLLSLPLSLFTIEEEPRERPHQHPREHCVRSDHSLAQLGLHAFHGSACVTRTHEMHEAPVVQESDLSVRSVRADAGEAARVALPQL
jgi:hypothetical protein